MDDDELSVVRLQRQHHLAAIQVICAVLHWYANHRNHTSQMSHESRLEGEKTRDELMKYLSVKTIGATMRKRLKVCEPSQVNTIDAVDHLVSQNRIILDNVGQTHVNVDQNEEEVVSPMIARSQENSQGSISFKAKKAKKNIIEDDMKNLADAITSVANAINDSSKELANALLAKNASVDCDIWALLEEMGVDAEIEDDAYVFLSENPKILESVVKCRIDRRKSVLMKYMKRGSQKN